VPPRVADRVLAVVDGTGEGSAKRRLQRPGFTLVEELTGDSRSDRGPQLDPPARERARPFVHVEDSAAVEAGVHSSRRELGVELQAVRGEGAEERRATGGTSRRARANELREPRDEREPRLQMERARAREQPR